MDPSKEDCQCRASARERMYIVQEAGIDSIAPKAARVTQKPLKIPELAVSYQSRIPLLLKTVIINPFLVLTSNGTENWLALPSSLWNSRL